MTNTTDRAHEGLTDEELAVLAEDQEDERAAAGAADGSAPQTDTDAGEDPDAAADAAAGTGGEQPTETAQPPDIQFRDVPLVKGGEASEDISAKLDELREREEAITAQFDDGEITAKEFIAKTREIAAQRDELQRQALKAELAGEIAEAERERQWIADCQIFVKEHPEILRNDVLRDAFDSVLRRVTADEANAALSNTAQLQKAYQEWAAAIGIKPADKQATVKAEAEPGRPPRKIVPTLGGLPAAQIESATDGRFATLDMVVSKGGDMAEAAFAKLSPEEQEAYLRA